MANENRILIKLRPTDALRAADSRVNLRRLYGGLSETASGVAGTPDWYVAELPEGGATPWDLAHAQVARQLGVAESDILFAEPDLVHRVYLDTNETAGEKVLGIGANCEATPQDGTHGKAPGPDHFAWHLDDEFSGLKSARDAVKFSEPRTRIAHLDTGYFRAHITTPEFIVHSLEKNFVVGDANAISAEDPDN